MPLTPIIIVNMKVMFAPMKKRKKPIHPSFSLYILPVILGKT